MLSMLRVLLCSIVATLFILSHDDRSLVKASELIFAREAYFRKAVLGEVKHRCPERASSLQKSLKDDLRFVSKAFPREDSIFSFPPQMIECGVKQVCVELRSGVKKLTHVLNTVSLSL